MELPEMRLARYAPLTAFRNGNPTIAAFFHEPIPMPELPESLFPDRSAIPGRRGRLSGGGPATAARRTGRNLVKHDATNFCAPKALTHFGRGSESASTAYSQPACGCWI